MPVRTEPGYSIEQAENDIGSLRGSHDSLNEYAEFTTAVVAGIVVAQQPGTTHSLAGDGTPMTQETAHSLTLSVNTWSGTLRYWMNPNNTVHISISNATAGSPANGVTIATLPSGYQPTATRGFACGCNTANSLVSSYISVDNAGHVQTTGIGAGSTGVFAEGDIPLF